MEVPKELLEPPRQAVLWLSRPKVKSQLKTEWVQRLTIRPVETRFPWDWSTSRLLILGGILVTSDGKTECVVGPPGDVIHDGGCQHSFGTYKGKESGSWPSSGHAS